VKDGLDRGEDATDVVQEGPRVVDDQVGLIESQELPDLAAGNTAKDVELALG
jgi:hypothetical protein